MLPNEARARSDEASEHERDEHGVVELAHDRHEVRDQIERHRQIRDERTYEELVSPRQPLVLQEPREQHDAIGHEPSDGAGVNVSRWAQAVSHSRSSVWRWAGSPVSSSARSSPAVP